MPQNQHVYTTVTQWTGNRGTGTSGYREYGREHETIADGKSAVILGSSTPAFRGEGSRYNPEELLVASLSSCHMLWFLHLCADAHIVVTSYRDEAAGTLDMHADGSGEFTRVVLHPVVGLTDPAAANRLPELHERAHELCFIARSVNFEVTCEASVKQ